MSIGQLLLTAGVALWVFDAKKIPKLVTDFASIVFVCQRFYHRVLLQWDTLVQQKVNEQTLAKNDSKARLIDGDLTNNFDN